MGVLITPLIALIQVLVKESPKYIPLILSAISTAGVVIASNVNLEKLDEIKVAPKALPNLTRAVLQIGYDARDVISVDTITSIGELSLALESYLKLTDDGLAQVDKIVVSPLDQNKDLSAIGSPQGLALLTLATRDAQLLMRIFGNLNTARAVQRIFLTGDDNYFDLMKNQTNRIR